MPDLPLDIDPLRDADLPAVEKLDDRAFGPGRFARSAYRLREGVAPDFALSRVAHVGTFLVGANRMTPIRVGGAAQRMTPTRVRGAARHPPRSPRQPKPLGRQSRG